MEISIKWNICRICLQEENGKEKVSSGGDGCQMRHIFTDSKLSKQIYECSGVLVDPQDSLPDKICKKCLTVLRYAVNFRNTCRNSDEYLQTVLKKAKSATSLFKLEKQREESLHTVEYVIEELEEHLLESYAQDDEYQDGSGIDKRRRNHQSDSEVQSQVSKKSKVIKSQSLVDFGTEVEEVSEDNEFFTKKVANLEGKDKSALVQKAMSVSPNDELNLTVKSTSDELLQNIRCNEKIIAPTSDDNKVSEKNGEKKSEEVLKDTDGSFLMDIEIKTETTSQAESECGSTEDEMGLFEEALCEEQEEQIEGEENEEDGEEEEGDFVPIQQESSTTLKITKDIYEQKDLLLLEATQQVSISNKGSKCISAMADAERDFFYVISVPGAINNDKTKIAERVEELNGVEQAEYIEIEEESKSERDNVNIEEDGRVIEGIEECEEENIEYLIESADENSLSTLDFIVDHNEQSEIEKSIKGERAKRKAVREPRVYVCDICGNHFTNRNLLNFHMKIHRNEKNFECELCYKRFNSACNLSAHMRIHTGEKPYECQFCARRFTDRSTHIKHERIHTNEKPYTCGTCGKSFSLSTSLRAHEKIHTGEKPYRCEPCSKSFKLPHQLKAHLNTHLHKLLSVEQ